ncbi:ankyrin repeat domain-containing protein [bacterium]|nr:ankyrin repeat domain-containing protein [bacterium]
MKHILLTTIAAVVLVGTAFADPIHDAARDGDLAGVQAELDKGVDVDAKDIVGGTPLHYATLEGGKEVTELLIENGADVNAKSGKSLYFAGDSTPLHTAMLGGNRDVADVLIANGADVNVKEEYGMTPLHIAAYFGHKEIAELLIAEGADVNAKSRGGHMRMPMTPLDKAKGEPWDSPEAKAAIKETADLLRKHGGKTAAELNALMPRLVQHGRFAFSFDAKEGKVYEVQDSFDLLNWEVIKTYTGTGTAVRFDEERDHDPPQWFYRVKLVE